MMRRLSLFLLALALAFLLLPHAFPPLAGYCRANVARPLTALIGGVSARVPFPLAGVLFVALAAAILSLSILARRFRLAARCLALFLSGVFCAYAMMWGCLYARPPTHAIELTPAALNQLCQRLIDEADDALARVRTKYTFPDLLEAGCRLMSAQTQLPLVPAKAASRPNLLSALGLAGFYSPLTGEAVVNPGDCPDTLPFTICHELAHQAGIAREDEANFCAFLACERGNLPRFRYAACFTTLLYTMRSLRAVDQAAWERAISHMSPALSARFNRANGPADIPVHGMTRIQRAVTDAFLRLSGDSYGIDSYEHVLPLIAAHWGIR